MYNLANRYRGVSWYGTPTKNSSTTKTSAVVQSPVYRGKGIVKPYDIELNIDLSTVVNGGHFGLMR